MTHGTVTAPKGHNMSAQGKQPRAPRQTMPCVVGLHHARPRLRSPGLRIAESAQSPERAQQMANQTNTDSQARTIGDRTNAAQRGDAPSIARRCASRRQTAAPVRGDCCALSGLLGLIVSLTQGGVTARKTRSHLPWADMLRPLRGKQTRGGVSRWVLRVVRSHDKKGP